MAESSLNYNFTIHTRCNRVLWNVGLEPVGVIDIQIIRRIQNEIRTAEGEIIASDTRIAQPSDARIAIPFNVLLNPSIRARYVVNQLQRLNIDRFTCYYLAFRTIYCALDNTHNNHLGFHMVSELTVTMVVLTEEILPAISSEGGGSALEKLKREKFDGGIGGDVCCPICLGELTAGMECSRTTCSHVFHSECIIPWLTKKNSCPICRQDLN